MVKKIDEAKKLEEINDFLDKLFADFSLEFKLPAAPNKPKT